MKNTKLRNQFARTAMNAYIIRTAVNGNQGEIASKAFEMADAMMLFLEVESRPMTGRFLGHATTLDVAAGCHDCPNPVVAAYSETVGDTITRFPVCDSHALDIAADYGLQTHYNEIMEADFLIGYPSTPDELCEWLLDGSPHVMKSPGIKGITDAD